MGSVFDDRTRQQLGGRRAAPSVDVGSVGVAPDGDDVGACRLEQVSGQRGSAPVGAVDDDPQAIQVPPIKCAEQVLDVRAAEVIFGPDRSHPMALERPGPLHPGIEDPVQLILDGLFKVHGELYPPGAEQRDAVVAERIVRRRDDDGGQVSLDGQPRQRRSG